MSWMYSIELPQGALIKRQMQLTMDAVTFNGKSIPVAAIDVVKSQVTRQFVNGIPTATTYKVQLEGQGGLRQTMKWSFASLQKQETKDKCEQAYRTMIDLIRDGRTTNRGEPAGQAVAHQVRSTRSPRRRSGSAGC